ncbi:MAG TPA: ABC-type transport auxiliary lipoprotein family protein [Nitrospira sp.]|nr:ABC-type transport auxiliary lipoprotein family protein [Nitrospira sp.]
MMLRTVGTAGILFALAGCVNLNKSYPDKRSFVLDVTPEERAPTSEQGMVLRIIKFRVSPLFVGRAMVYRVTDLQYENDFYNEWFVAPGTLLTQQFQDWLSKSGRFTFVLKGTNHIEPTHVLEGNVTEFYGDYRVDGAPKAVFGIDLHLLDARDERQVLFTRTYRRQMPLTDRSPDRLAAGLTQAVREVLADLDRDLAELPLEPVERASFR